MSYEPEGPKSNHKEPVGSTSDCLTLLPKETCQKSNRQEPVDSTSYPLMFVLDNMRHIQKHNTITAPPISNTY